jgi:hypothetical protein
LQNFFKINLAILMIKKEDTLTGNVSELVKRTGTWEVFLPGMFFFSGFLRTLPLFC